ncbi:hypothetical protein [Actinoplanes subglobosus]|uniref:Uncharacterized protein n=1 Tax=Actinoplanes subglobosus TaxID=1547892 RepID=A0ABV8J2M3_9ACTN
MTEAYPSREDRIVAEFGDGYEVEGIAARYGLTVEQVFAVVEREVGPAGQAPPPGHYAPPAPGHYAPPAPGHYAPPAPGHYAPPAPGYQGIPGYPVPPEYQGPIDYRRPADHPGPGFQTPPGSYPPQPDPAPLPPGYPAPAPPPAYYAPSSYEAAESAVLEAVVADYGDGHDVAMIAGKYGITVEQVYLVVQRVLGSDRP